MPTKLLFTVTMSVLSALAGRQASANDLDLSVVRFIECNAPSGSTPGGVDCLAHNDAYERFLAEYSFGISPKLMAPASTLGYSGFYLGIEASVAGIPDGSTAKFDAASPNYEDSRWRIGTAKYGAKPPKMYYPTIHVRKGLPWSFELGSSIGYLGHSELITLGGEVKWSLFEGYSKGVLGVLPDLAVRGTVNRVIGQSDVDMTLVGVDGSISRPFGIAGVMSIEPYAGYQLMWTIVRTEPMALFNPGGALVQPEANRYDPSEANLSGPNLMRHKIFGGFVYRYEFLAITMDWTIGLPASWTTDQYTSFPLTTTEKVDVKTKTQVAYSLGVGLQF
ncbi:MAG: hypothetical protein JXX14_11155 [Deltaproteobacteria bacterium]|nr:hypothetical protein [Deltaproteobacteria bacterium]